MKIYKHAAGLMTKMAANGPISIKLGMKHRGNQVHHSLSNVDAELTFTCFTAKLNFATYAFIWRVIIHTKTN